VAVPLYTCAASLTHHQELEDVSKATGAGEVHEDFISNLSRISQLTGFSDPIYAEAYVKVHGFDILLGTGSAAGTIIGTESSTQMCFWLTKPRILYKAYV